LNQQVQRHQGNLIQMREGMQYAGQPKRACSMILSRCINESSRSGRHQRTPARLAQGCSPKELKALRSSHCQVFRLNRHNGINIGKVKHTDQTCFTLRNLMPVFW
jgi:hypothetical protein